MPPIIQPRQIVLSEDASNSEQYSRTKARPYRIIGGYCGKTCKFVILSKRSASKDLRSYGGAVQESGAKILRLRAMPSAQDDSIVPIIRGTVRKGKCGMRADDIRPYAVSGRLGGKSTDFVIPRERSESRDLRSNGAAMQTFSAKILRLRAMPSAQDDSIVRIIRGTVRKGKCGMRADDLRPCASVGT